MREKFKYAGQTVKIKNGVGCGFGTKDLSGRDFTIEDWAENVFGHLWMHENNNPAALEYTIRSTFFGINNDVPRFSNDVVYGKIGMFGHLFHVNELELPSE